MRRNRRPHAIVIAYAAPQKSRRVSPAVAAGLGLLTSIAVYLAATLLVP